MLELVPTKLPHYILPVLPALCLILAGRVIAPVPPQSNGAVGWACFALSWSCGGFGFAVVAFWGAMVFGGADSQAMLYAILVLLLALVTMMFGHYWISRGLWSPFFAMLGAGLLLHFVFFAGLVPSLSRLHVSGRG